MLLMSSQSTAAELFALWEQWQLPFTQTPTLIKELSGGLTNRCYLIELEEQRCVLRINNKAASRLGINRQQEATILQHASQAGIAPEVLYCSPEQGLLISRYLEGHHWHSSELSDETRQSSLVELLQRCHALEVDIPEFNYFQYLHSYWERLQASDLNIPDKLHRDRESITHWLKDFSADRKICHHDPVPQNILVCNDTLYLLDWEYAGLGWPEFDYAALVLEWNLPGNRQTLSNHMSENIQQLQSLYMHLCDLWTLLGGNRISQ